MQKVRGDAGFVGLRVDARTTVVEVMPVEQHPRKRGGEPLRDRHSIASRTFRLDGPEHRATRAQHIHRVRVAQHELECLPERSRQPTPRREPLLEGIELRARRQLSI
jgi:hypothetical protein